MSTNPFTINPYNFTWALEPEEAAKTAAVVVAGPIMGTVLGQPGGLRESTRDEELEATTGVIGVVEPWWGLDDTGAFGYVDEVVRRETAAGIADEDAVERFFADLNAEDYNGQLSEIYVEAVQEMSRCAQRYANSSDKMVEALAGLQRDSHWNQNMSTNPLHVSSDAGGPASDQNLDWRV